MRGLSRGGDSIVFDADCQIRNVAFDHFRQFHLTPFLARVDEGPSRLEP